MNTKDFQFQDQEPFTRYVVWKELLQSKEPILKRFIVFVTGFHYYAGGITGVSRWSHFKVLNGTGWESRKEAYEWCKANQVKPYSVSSKDPYGKGAKCQTVQIMRLDNFIKYILDDRRNWYLRSTGSFPDHAEFVN